MNTWEQIYKDKNKKYITTVSQPSKQEYNVQVYSKTCERSKVNHKCRTDETYVSSTLHAYLIQYKETKDWENEKIY